MLKRYKLGALGIMRSVACQDIKCEIEGVVSK